MHDPNSIVALLRLRVVGLCLLLLAAWLALISWDFAPTAVPAALPIVPAVLVLTGMFGIYLLGVRFARAANDQPAILRTIVVYAVLLRVTLLFSMPILEVDLYRYLWDGTVTTQGISPYAFSPQQVLDVGAYPAAGDDPRLQVLVDAQRESDVRATLLRRVHFPELTTIYPPVSQLVFAAVVACIPSNAPEYVFVFAIKAVMIGFDLATLTIIIALLRLCGQPASLVIVYAWCPLVLKEIVNSGHLDSIAVFFSTAFLYGVCRFLHLGRGGGRLGGPAVWLALGVGAKIFPILFLGAAFVVVYRRSQAWVACGFGLLVLVLSFASLLPMFLLANDLPATSRSAATVSSVDSPSSSSAVSDNTPPDALSLSGRKHGHGLTAFASHWEMNDFVFSLVQDSIRPNSQVPAGRAAWFAPVPDLWREHYARWASGLTRLSPAVVSSWTAKGIALGLWAGIVLVVLIRLARNASGLCQQASEASLQALCRAFVESSFLVVAWFWMLSPTQNPWYWVWLMPMLACVRNRGWMLTSGLAMTYYLRFAFLLMESSGPLLGTPYAGAAFFDKVVVWCEFVPLFIALIIGHFIRRE